MSQSKIKKIANVFLNVIVYLFLAICVFSVLLTLFSKRSADGAAEIFGYQMRVVTSDSMAKCENTDVSQYDIKHIPIRSMVFVEVMPDDPIEADEWYRDLQVGDVLTFYYVYNEQVVITHRVVKPVVEKPDGGFIIELAGDNVNSEGGQLVQVIDTSVPMNPNYVIGKVTGQSYLFGLVMSFLMQPAAIILVIILPCAIIILLEVVKIIKVFSADKKKRQQEELAEKENELEELRRRLAELESNSKNQN